MQNNPEIIETDEVVADQAMLTRSSLRALVAAANEAAPAPVRTVNPALVNKVVERAYMESEGLPVVSRNFAIQRAVNNFLDLATKGIVASAATNHFDLLPVAHPYSTAATFMSENQIRKARAEWVAAEPGVKEEHKPVIAAALTTVPGTTEALHAEIRLLSLVAAGYVPEKVTSYSTAITASAGHRVADPSDALNYYHESRAILAEIVYNQTALTASGNPYDSNGTLIRRIVRGDSTKSILAYLENNPVFAESLANRNADLSSADPYAQYGQSQFNLFYDALSNMADSPVPVDLRKVAIEAISEYDTTGAVAKAITAGANSSYVFMALEGNPDWDLNLREFYMDDEADPEFTDAYFSILDLDTIPESFVPLEEVLPAK